MRAVRPQLLAVLFLAGVDCAFLAPALFGPAVRAPADITPHWPPFAADSPSPPPPRNSLLQDWVVQFHPWQHLVREAYAAGRMPLWNDKSGCGEPLLANGQCEALSPFLPLNLLTGDQYADWRQLAQLLVAQAFCLLLASHLGLSTLAGIVVALGYSFSSFMQIWAVHPHSASAAFAPGILWALLRIGAVPSAGRVLVAALCIACSMLAGHVETAAKAAVGAGAVALIAGLLRRPAAGRIRFTVLVGLAGICGLLLAACLLVPFFDYLRQSEIQDLRKMYLDQPLPLRQLVTLLDLDALGSALTPPTYRGVGSYPDAVQHVGTVGIVLAVVGILLGIARRPAIVVPLVVVAAAGVVIACGVVPVTSFWSSIPGLGDIWPFRFLYLILLPLAVLSGIGFDELGRLFRGRWPIAGRIAGAAVVVATAVTAALPWRDFLPAAPLPTLHPPSRALEKLRARAATGRSVEIGRVLPAGFGELYGFRRLSRYDAIGLRRFGDFFRRPPDDFQVFGNDVFTFAPSALLDAASVRWVLSMYPAHEVRFPARVLLVANGAEKAFDVAELGPLDRPLDLVVFRRGFEPSLDGTIELAIARDGGETVWTLGPQGFTSGSAPMLLPATSAGVQEFVQTQVAGFQPVAFSIPSALLQGAKAIVFRVRDGGAPCGVTALLPYGIGTDVVDADNMGWLRILERRRAMPFAYLSAAVTNASSQEDAAMRVHARGFDPRAATVVEIGPASGPPPQPPLGSNETAVLRRIEPGLIDVEVRSAAKRMLVVTDAYEWGWRATVDGAEVPVFPANVIGKACWVPAGTHSVTMRYAPRSFTIGWLISVGTLLILSGFAVAGRFRAGGPGPTSSNTCPKTRRA